MTLDKRKDFDLLKTVIDKKSIIKSYELHVPINDGSKNYLNKDIFNQLEDEEKAQKS